MVHSFDKLNAFSQENNVTNEMFTNACKEQGLTDADIQNLQSFRLEGHASSTEKGSNADVGVLQKILGKLGLQNGMVEGKPDEKFGSGTVKDVESLSMNLQSKLTETLLWRDFNDTLSAIPNGSISRYNKAFRKIKETGKYNPEENPVKSMDETVVATGLNSGEGQRKYTVQFLASMPENLLTKVAQGPQSANAFLVNRKNREHFIKKWEDFRNDPENQHIFTSELLTDTPTGK